MNKRLVGLALFAVATVSPAPALAQEAPDVGSLMGFIRFGGVLLSVPVVISAMVVMRILGDIADRLSKRFASRRPLIQKVESFARFAIYIAVAAVTVGLSIRLDPTALTVIGGALAFAVGFAMRDLVAAFIAGITIMFDRPFQVGDRVEYAGQYGDIIKIGLRSVQMNTLDHNIVTIPNNKILTDVTSCGNYGNLEMQVPMDFYIGADQDVRLASELIREACLTSPYVFFDMPVPVLVKQLVVQNYVAVQLKARPYVYDCKQEKPFETDVHMRVIEAFRKHGINPPAILHRTRETVEARPDSLAPEPV
ncbi:MAG: mechanosensitive ion channel family protein [Myxococcales bacterium]|nr:mechanosensitive ion channel family protein [Myxococcales bacterium]